MSIFSWLHQLIKSSDNNTNLEVNQQTFEVTEREAMILDNLDFLGAIESHQQWKSRLSNYLNDISTETLNHEDVCRDDLCVLGKWINNTGAQKYGQSPTFSELKMAHASFHLAAGSIIRLKDQGQESKADELLHRGEYPKQSIKVQGLISTLYMELKEEGTEGI